MAMAYRVYKEFDSMYAKKCLEAAQKAYEWLRIHKEPKLFHNPANVWSGEYGDKSDLDERYWAAAELYRSTGEEIYHEDFLTYYSLIEDRLALGWGTVSGYGTIAYLFSGRKVKKEIYDSLVQEWMTYAKELVERSRKNGYGITLKLEDYIWGSNMILMNQAIHLILAQKLQPNTEYTSVVQNNWDYLLGRNPMDISYVSGLGERAIMHPHHRPSTADNVLQPIPGLVSGGPCAGLIDNAVKEYCTGNPPAKCFVDMVKSYSTNEIAIYWNSPAVYVGAYLCSRAKSHIPGENIS
jgi:endoglucanase